MHPRRGRRETARLAVVAVARLAAAGFGSALPPGIFPAVVRVHPRALRRQGGPRARLCRQPWLLHIGEGLA